MKKTHKRLLGFLGLSAVVAMTFFAAMMPGPDTSAIDATSVTDEITVRVLDTRPSINIVSPSDGEVTANLNEPIEVHYTYAEDFNITVTWVDPNDPSHTITDTIYSGATEGETGDAYFDFREYGMKYGYGTYILNVSGKGIDGVDMGGDSVSFEYSAVKVSVEEDEDTGNVYVNVDYNKDGSDIPEDSRVSKVEITITGNGETRTITVNADDITNGRIEIPFEELGLTSGSYTIIVTPYNSKNEPLYRTFAMSYKYEEPAVPYTAAPDTGGMFKNMNISRVDFLVTGLGVFLVVGVGGIIFINKRSKKSSTRRRK